MVVGGSETIKHFPPTGWWNNYHEGVNILGRIANYLHERAVTGTGLTPQRCLVVRERKHNAIWTTWDPSSEKVTLKEVGLWRRLAWLLVES